MYTAHRDFGHFLDTLIIPNLRQAVPDSSVSTVEVVLLTCLDFPYPHRIIETMDERQLKGKYDHLILAGASLGIPHKTEWQTTFIDELRFSVDKHGASQVIILDHQDCGAYKEFLGSRLIIRLENWRHIVANAPKRWR